MDCSELPSLQVGLTHTPGHQGLASLPWPLQPLHWEFDPWGYSELPCSPISCPSQGADRPQRSCMGATQRPSVTISILGNKCPTPASLATSWAGLLPCTARPRGPGALSPPDAQVPHRQGTPTSVPLCPLCQPYYCQCTILQGDPVLPSWTSPVMAGHTFRRASSPGPE